MARIAESIDRYFGISESGSDIATEVKGGIVTFLAMVYILTVNPLIVSPGAPGVSWNALFTSTAVAAIVSCLLMGLYARFPVALAPGMGVNAFLSITMCQGMGLSYPQALLGVLFSGILFFILSVTGARAKMMKSFPEVLRYSFTAGIGLFIAVVGLYNAQIIVHPIGSAMALGDMTQPGVLLALFALFLTIGLWFRKVWGAVLISIVISVVIGLLAGFIPVPTEFVDTPDFSLIGSMFSAFSEFQQTQIIPFVAAVIALSVMDMFDTTGTILAISDRVKDSAKFTMDLTDRALEVDSVSTMIGSLVGTTTTTSFIESCTGIESGARTGLMAVVTGIMFALALFFAPLFGTVTSECIVGAVVLVGILMITAVKGIEWKDNVNAATGFMTISMIALSGSITDGMALGTFTYLLGSVLVGRTSEVPRVIWLLGIVFVFYFVIYHGYLALL